MRGPFSRESSHQPHDPRQRYSESPKKSSSLSAAKRASKEQTHGENKDRNDKNGKKEGSEAKKDNESNDPTNQVLPSGQPQSHKGSSDQSHNSEPQETSTKDQETGEETQQQVVESEGVCSTSPGQFEGVAKENTDMGASKSERGDLHPTNGDSQASPRSLEGGSLTEGKLEVEDGVGEGSGPSDTKVTKDPSHRLSLPLNELIRSVITVLSTGDSSYD